MSPKFFFFILLLYFFIFNQPQNNISKIKLVGRANRQVEMNPGGDGGANSPCRVPVLRDVWIGLGMARAPLDRRPCLMGSIIRLPD